MLLALEAVSCPELIDLYSVRLVKAPLNEMFALPSHSSALPNSSKPLQLIEQTCFFSLGGELNMVVSADQHIQCVCDGRADGKLIEETTPAGTKNETF